jgi:hypothetical protein
MTASEASTTNSVGGLNGLENLKRGGGYAEQQFSLVRRLTNGGDRAWMTGEIAATDAAIVFLIPLIPNGLLVVSCHGACRCKRSC